MTKKGNISGLFGKSPISPLQQHMKQVHSCIKEFGIFAKAANSEDWEKAKLAQLSIGKKEQKADVLKKKLRMNLPSTFMMPFSRRDLLDVLLIQDSIANITKDLAGLMMSRQMSFPKEFADDFLKLTKLCIQTSAAALVAINELDELLETAFSSRERKIVDTMIQQVNDLEHETDVVQDEIRNKLFLVESSLAPVDVMFYYRAIEWLGETADAAQKVGSRFEVMLTK
ncbi:MAG: TIGR00153 family protein [Thiotrichales bacterium]|nr:TIGR00153 family protein [Thiotrichales bacterium]